jgi:hypothetical protein
MIISNGMKLGGVGALSLVALVSAACGSSSSGATTGTGASSTAASTGSTSTGGSTSSSAATTGSGAGTSASSSTTTTAASSSSGSSGTCSPTADANALACPAGLCAIGNGGYDFTFSDTGPMTTICVAANSACAKGTLTPANPPSYSYYGAGLGINLGPAADGGMPAPVQLTGTGISVTLSNLPAGGARLQITVGGVSYCAPLTTASATVPWASFNTKCYDSPPDGVALTAAPASTNVEISLPSGTAEQSFDFCIESITL